MSDQMYASNRRPGGADPMFLVTGKAAPVLLRGRSSSDSISVFQRADEVVPEQRDRASSLSVLQNAGAVAVAIQRFSQGPKKAPTKKGN